MSERIRGVLTARRAIPLSVLIGILIWAVVATSFATSMSTLKSILGIAAVTHSDQITIEGYNYVDPTHVSVTISTDATTKPACTITVSGAGISGEKDIPSGWTSPLAVTIEISGTLGTGTVVIEVSSS